MQRLLAVLALATVGLAACGGSTKAAAPPPTTVSPAQQQAAVATMWSAFFSSTTPLAQTEALLQNGTSLATQIAALHKLIPAGLTAKVDSVAVTGTTALVTYELIAGGHSLLGHPSTGNAVQIAGKWLVSQPTFCSLSTLAGSPCAS
jgi:hypothetical protein